MCRRGPSASGTGPYITRFTAYLLSLKVKYKVRIEWISSHDLARSGSFRWRTAHPTNGQSPKCLGEEGLILAYYIRKLCVRLQLQYFLNSLSALLGDTSLGRYNKNPRMRVQKAENVNKALEFITSRGVKLTNIGPEGMLVYEHYNIDITLQLLNLHSQTSSTATSSSPSA